MTNMTKHQFAVLALGIFLGLIGLGYLLGKAAIEYRQFERTVTVKGLSEREMPADVVIWPLTFTEANNDLGALYRSLDIGTEQIRRFLIEKGIDPQQISVNAPAITDKLAQQYGSGRSEYRYSATQTVTVYSDAIDTVRAVMGELSELGKQGLVFSGDNYMSQTEYLFTRLNDIKPDMIEEATRNAREVAEKFAEDSSSHLGKIKTASQGQFSITARDNNNPHIKRIRVVSTIEYYLSD